MNEEYLQLLWASKKIRPVGLTTVTGESLEILDFGVWNKNLSGPDFSYGRIKLVDIELVGPIEIHINNSDWIKHKHHRNKHYNNVILHVVLNYDKPFEQAGRLIPTLEINKFIDPVHYKLYRESRSRTIRILCEDEVSKIEDTIVESMKLTALRNKWENRIKEFSKQKNDQVELLYGLIGRSFGMNVNQLSFIELTESITYNSLKNLPLRFQRNLLFSESKIAATNDGNWSFKGLHAKGNPMRRLTQFIIFVTNVDIRNLADSNSPSEFKKKYNHELHELSKTSLEYKFSEFLFNQIWINAIVPFFWYKGDNSNDVSWEIDAMNSLKNLKPEKYASLNNWKQIGVELKNAYDSQAFLGLEKYYCSRKKCLNCTVGKSILGR